MIDFPEGSFREDLIRGRYDPVFFAHRFLGIELHPGQVRFAEAVVSRNRARPWEAAYFNICVSSGNRAGKTMAMAAIGVHHCIYKLGLEAPETEGQLKRWLKLPYAWFHFGIESEIAGLVHAEIVQLLAGIHPAQGERGCPLTAAIPNVANTDTKWNGMWPWIKFSPILGGADVHFRTTRQEALGSLGRDMHLITFDEVGFERRLPFLMSEVFHFRRLGTGGPIVLISTPTAGITDFADEWMLGDPDYPDRQPRRFSMRMSTRDNVGFGLDEVTFGSLIEDLDDDLIAQNIDGYFVQAKETFFHARKVNEAFHEELPELQAAQNGHFYAQGVDPALTYDECWSIMLDITDPERWIGVECGYLAGRRTTDDLLELMVSQYNSYEVNRTGFRSSASLGLDATGMGGKMIRERLNDAGVFDLRNIEFGGRTQTKGKRKVLADLRLAIDSGRLWLPKTGPWLRLRRQLLRYRVDITKPDDDGVMALGCAVQEALRYGGGGPSAEASVSWDARLAGPRPQRYAHPSSVPLIHR